MIKKISNYGTLVILGTLLLLVYKLQLVEANEYLGYVNFSISLEYVSAVLVSILFISLILPKSVEKPSDFFVFLYGIFVIFPYAVLFPIRGLIGLLDFFINFLILIFPVLCIAGIARINISANIPVLIGDRKITLIILLLSVFGVVIAYFTAPESAGFDVNNSYDRRLDARDGVASGSMAAYLIAATTNGFGPYLAFQGALRKQLMIVLFSMACGIAVYYFYGVKTPILIVCVALIIGQGVRTKRIHGFVRLIRNLLACVIVFALIEHFVFGYSFVGDYFVRRALTVPPYIVSAFFEFMDSSQSDIWSAFSGAQTSEPITFVVGEVFLDSPGLNANTNAFLYQLAANGIFSYLATIILVAFVFNILNSAYAAKRQPAMLYLGFLYAILLTEQAATTALVSSGVGFLIILLVFSEKGESTELSDKAETAETTAVVR